MTPAFLENSMIVGAHPDDEFLWFTAIAGSVDQVVIVFRDYWAEPELGDRRSKAIERLPLSDVTCLDIPEPGTYGCANWKNPQLTDYGLELGFEETRRELVRRARNALATVTPGPAITSPFRINEHYKENFALIRDSLEPLLSADMNVFTHNPWGEYGHEDHVQVFRALDHLRRKIGFKLWMSNYCTERTLPLASRYFQKQPQSYIRLPADQGLAAQMAEIYQEEQCWTWADDWAWFNEECYVEAPFDEAGGEGHHLLPLNMFTIEPPRDPLASVPVKLTSALLLSAFAGASLAYPF